MTTRRDTPGFERRACDDEIVASDDWGRRFTGTRVATVTVEVGEGGSTRWEVIGGGGEEFVVLETTGAEGGAARTRHWGLPAWREYPDALLAACRSADEVRAWLGLPLVEPVEGGEWWWHFEALEEAREEERRQEEEAAREAEEWDDMGMPDAGHTGAMPAGPFRPIPLADLPETTLGALGQRLAALARTLPLDLAASGAVAAAARKLDVYDRGVDVFGGVEWRVIAEVGWAGRRALVVGTLGADEVSDPDPASMELRLLAPAEREEAGALATREEIGGVELPGGRNGREAIADGARPLPAPRT